MGLGLDLFGQRKNGSEFPIEIGLTSIQTREGLLAMALVTDISERHGLKQTARQQEKLAALATQGRLILPALAYSVRLRPAPSRGCP